MGQWKVIFLGRGAMLMQTQKKIIAVESLTEVEIFIHLVNL